MLLLFTALVVTITYLVSSGNGKTDETRIIIAIVLFIGVRLLAKPLLGTYRAIGFATFWNEHLVLTDLNGQEISSVPYSDFDLLHRSPGIPLTGNRNSSPRTAHVEVIRKKNPRVLFEVKWRTIEGETHIEDVIRELREYLNLSLF